METVRRIGGRKFVLGLTYMLGCFGLLALGVYSGEAAIVGAVAGGCVSMAPGVGAIIWGNVKEHQANGGD